MMNAKTENTISTPNSNNSNIKEDNRPEMNIAIIADIATENQKVKTYRQQHNDLWQKAWKLAEWIDDSNSNIPWQERSVRVPELQEISMTIDELEMLMG